jgi:hypothetical protein
MTELHSLGLAEQVRTHGWSWTSAGAALGLCGGVVSSIFGSILTATSWFTGPQWHGFSVQRDGTVLFLLMIPFLLLGAHCLDLLDKQNQRRAKLSARNPELR